MRADFVIKNAWVFMTYRQCFEKRDVAVAGESFYCVSPAISYPGVREVDGSGKYLIPGLIDIHMHIESSMTYPQEFSRITLPYGVTTVVADAHEIANVFGLEGIRCFMEQKTPQDIFYAIPSSVPATNETLETTGASIGEAEVRRLAEDERVLCLGEVMNFKDLTADEDTLIKRLIRCCRESGGNKRIEGHCPALSGEDLCRFIYEGVDADHTQQTPESVMEKTDLGMFLELQLKSLTEDVVRAVCNNGLYENVALVTDDTMPDRLLKGQLNRIVKAAVKAGMPVEKAIYCATFTPARRMHLDDRGLIGPGKLADFVVLRDLESFEPEAVFKSGKCVFEEMDAAGVWSGVMGERVAADGRDIPEDCNVPDAPLFPAHFYHSVRCKKAEPGDFTLRVDVPCAAVRVNVMKIRTFGTFTEQAVRTLPVKDGEICWEGSGLTLAALFERYGKNGNISYGLVEGAFTGRGAAATTWSHDSHNLLVLGTAAKDMCAAQNRVLELQGGYVAAEGGRVTAEAGLPVGGIINDGPVEALAKQLGRVREAMRRLGYENNNEIMSMSTLCLPVSPSLKLTDFGLLEVKTQRRVALIQAYLDENGCEIKHLG
ncbi:adenine deaminase C-terminal domain-containing protein [Enterocloster asparagiformis]|uniref:adenine deaminase C-terminal domain-containing protein n=1 Tax=Enterocloster asparagiformis TaxID=333367 RepID=UPI002A828DC0|nr:adenine deaminase C-terminal domain-containing protein [Enterocloster asparagiformis]